LHCANTVIAGELLVNQLWYRTKAKIVWLLFGSTLEGSIAGPSPVAKLPQELVEMVISYFIFDTRSLLACSMTCYSWYIAAVPHLRHALTTDERRPYENDGRYVWPRPLQKSYELGLLPLVQRFRIRLDNNYTASGKTRLRFSKSRYNVSS